MRPTLFRLHRYLGLAFALLWALQAATGVMLAFHWELEDFALPQTAAPFDPAGLSDRIRALQKERAPGEVTSVYAAPGTENQFDILIATNRGTDAVRVDGAGAVLRDLPLDYDFDRAGVLAFVVVLHQSLFAEPYGRWLIGISGLVLLSNALLGLKFAWPQRGRWREALLPLARTGRRFATWHRALGLWLVIPAFLAVTTGALLAFQGPLRDSLGARISPPDIGATSGQGEVSPADAIRTALATYPGSHLAVIYMPSKNEPWYGVRVRQPGEWRRAYGTTTVFVDARYGRVLAKHDAFEAPLPLAVMDAAYPFHTGEALGMAGRILAFAVAVSLAIMVVLGLVMWATRKRA
jgi:uncharacterized iron-regulated membrane protein